MNYIPSTSKDRAQMLSSLGVPSIGALFEDIPKEVRAKALPELPPPLSEADLLKELGGLSEKNADVDHYVSFLGAGAYNHFLPAVVKHLVSRSEFYTAYTPYQAEASQGILQSIYEYQTMICNLTGMEVANASMYDGAQALVESALLACRHTQRKEVLVSEAVHPEYRKVLKTYGQGAGLKVEEFHFVKEGITDLERLKSWLTDKTAALILQQPNFFGCLEEINKIAEVLHEKGSLFIVSIDPVSLGLLKRPGDYGADIVTGEGQSLGSPLSYGGPYLGIFTAKKEFMRLMPGRMVGATVDTKGKPGYVLTLQTREQHIRRERATSNICTNEALNALAAVVYLAIMGKTGLRKVAQLCLNKAHYAKEKISSVPGFSAPFRAPTFKEFVVKSSVSPKDLEKKLLEHKIISGLDLGRYYPSLKDHILFCVTEMIRKEDIDRLVEVLKG